MNPYTNMLCATFFKGLWSILSSRVAMVLYFVLLFGSIAAMIISVLYLTNEKKQAKKPENKKETADEEDEDENGF